MFILYCGGGKTSKNLKGKIRQGPRKEDGPWNHTSQMDHGKMDCQGSRVGVWGQAGDKNQAGSFLGQSCHLAHRKWGIIRVRQELKLATDWF